jgi:hypothetical protein
MVPVSEKLSSAGTPPSPMLAQGELAVQKNSLLKLALAEEK